MFLNKLQYWESSFYSFPWGCLHYLLFVKLFVSSSTFLSFGPLVWVTSLPTLRRFPSIWQERLPKYFSLWYGFGYSAWFPETLSVFWGKLFFSFHFFLFDGFCYQYFLAVIICLLSCFPDCLAQFLQLILFSCFSLSYLPNPSARAGYDTRSIFKLSLTGSNSAFSFS